MRVERAWTDAHVRGDFETIARLMADDYLKIEADGTVSDRAITQYRQNGNSRASIPF
jgi:ketosteroid isomerase-like protein